MCNILKYNSNEYYGKIGLQKQYFHIICERNISTLKKGLCIYVKLKHRIQTATKCFTHSITLQNTHIAE